MLMKLLMWWFRFKGWNIEKGLPPDVRKCILLAAPHTSNWDFIYGLGALGYFGYRVRYLAKAELFRKPFGWIFYNTGGIPVDRSRPNAMVNTVIDQLKKEDELVVLFPPEGTRKKVSRWKTGFYYAALGADLPIALGYLDYSRKVGGIDLIFKPSGNLKSDMEVIRKFYADKRPKIPENFSLPEIPD